MEILIVGKSGNGKSNLADLIKNAIFKADAESCININDPDRENKSLGQGKNEYNINVRREASQEDKNKADISVEINNGRFIERFKEIY
jgi:CO dehydrogenase nickel-insertion accessory protein CooC1